MGLEINGVQPTIVSPELASFIESYIDPADVVHFTQRAWPGFGNVGLTAPVGFRPPRPAKLNRLVWPGNSAARWAYMFLTMDANQLNYIHESVFGADGNSYRTVQLKIDSPQISPNGQTTTERYELISTRMYMLSPMPLTCVTNNLVGIPGSGLNPPDEPRTNNLYLITLVDERYWWQYVPWIPITLTDNTLWSDLLLSINISLSQYGLAGIFMDTVDPAYLGPSPTSWKLPYETIGQMIDALAFNVGMRFTRKFSGDCYIQTFVNAKAELQADWQRGSDSARLQIAGGDPWPTGIVYP